MNENHPDNWICNKAIELLKSHKYLCDNCLGRQFATYGSGLTNKERGFAIKTLLTINAHRLEDIELLQVLATHGKFESAIKTLTIFGIDTQTHDSDCFLCEGIFDDLLKYANQIIEKLNDIDFNTFLVGSRISTILLEREDELRAQFHISGEACKSELNRELGKYIQKLTGKNVNFQNPDIVILLDTINKEFTISVNPLFIYGHYRKLIRGIPQSTWICSSCQGKGCDECNGTGKRYSESIEELISNPTLELTEGKDGILHAAGREDIDAKMLGDGRPFVLEIKEPKIRNISLDKLQEAINNYAKGKVEVLDLKIITREVIRQLKARSKLSEKTYRLLVKVAREINTEDVQKIEQTFQSVTIDQRTPQRVLHRRKDKIRQKRVFSLKVNQVLDDNIMEVIVYCEGGLYVKELLTGDEGFTKPSVSELLNSDIKVLEIDVIKVHSNL
ncbi:MAG: tRNA pseudouridine(54/55) synthase Pus10 [Promethearchaeota archaeon]